MGEENKTQNAVQKAAEAGQKAKQTIQDAKTVAGIAGKIGAGDYLGAAADALKSGILKRNIKKILIQGLISLLIPVIIAGSLFSVINGIKDEMINLIASVGEAVSGFIEELWKKFTDDYWIDLNEKTKYVVDIETGESLAYYDKDDKLVLVKRGVELEYVEQRKSEGKTVDKDYTLVDEYVKDLGNKGIKLSALRLLGNEDVTNFDELLSDENKKTIVEKYISEFMRADIITQQVHRKKRSGDLVKISETENLVDGGIYVYRHRESDVTIEEGDFNNSSGKTSLGKIIFVGDSRTVDMFTEVDYKDGNYFSTTENGIDIYAMDGAGFDFLKDTINTVGDYDTLAVWLGANDKGNFSKYESYYEDLLTSGKKLILFDVGEIIDSVASVSPKLSAEQKEIYKDSYVINYNNAMNNWAESKRLNENKDVELDRTTYSGYGDVILSVDTTSDDGVHYNPKPTRKIWEHIYNKISNTYFNSDKDKDNNGENAGEGNSTEEIERIEKLDYNDLELMEYIEYEDFIKKIQDANGKTSIPSDLRLQFSINPKTDELVVAQIDEETVVEDSYNKEDLILPENLHQWFADRSGTTTYTVTEKPFKYKDKISKYAMPYEFLINLCEVTQNPEFVYHVALLARDTQIALVVNDNTTTVTETEDHEIVEKTYTNYKNSSTSGAEITNPKTKRERKMTVSKTQNPILELYFADTWSFYEKFKYTRTITATLTKETTEGDTDKPLPSTLDGPFTKEKTVDENSVPKPGEDEEKYWQSTFVTAHTITKSTLDEESNIGPPEVEESIEKSKHFLGLLRNTKGKCSESNCYDESSWKNKTDPVALTCARNAVFNEEGKNVSYRIPTMTKKEMPLNKLTSGLDILYAAMQSNGSGFDKEDLKVNTSQGQFAENNEGYKDYSGAYEMQEDAKAKGTWEGYKDSYVIKLQGLVEHIKYLMGFPPNEYYENEWDYRDEDGDGNNDNYDDSDGNITIVDGDIPYKIWCAMLEAGYTEEAAAGVLGNIYAESGFVPTAYNPKGGGIGAYGLAQWRSDRQRHLIEYAEQDKHVDKSDADTQIEYLVAEILGKGGCRSKSQYSSSYANEYNKWLNATNPEDAADGFMRWFERPGSTVSEVKHAPRSTKRESAARKYYDMFRNGGGIPIDDGTLSDKQKQLLIVLDNLSSYSGISNDPGYCQRFVRNVFEKIGISATAESATIAYRNWAVSDDDTNIPVGATVYGRGSSENGHVGIYIGDGKVVHNIGKTDSDGNPRTCSYGGLVGIKCDSLEYWKSFYHYLGWGWQAGVRLKD